MADFEISLIHDDATDGVPTDDELAHVRHTVSGLLAQLEGALPLGFSLVVDVDGRSESQKPVRIFDPSRPPKAPVDEPVDAFASVVEDECVSCGSRVAKQGEGGAWYHVQTCVNLLPRSEVDEAEGASDG